MRLLPTFALMFSIAALTAGNVFASEARYVVVIQGHDSGAMTVRDGATGELNVDFHYKTNGRGPTIKESIVTSADGGMTRYRVNGKSTFGGGIDESFDVQRGKASWRSSGDQGSLPVTGPVLYVPAASSSPATMAALARGMLLQPTRRLPAMPAGELSIRELARRKLAGPGGEREVILVAVIGEGLRPDLLWLDAKTLRLFAMVEGDFYLIAENDWRVQAKSLADETTAQGQALISDFSKQHAHRIQGSLLIRICSLNFSELHCRKFSSGMGVRLRYNPGQDF